MLYDKLKNNKKIPFHMPGHKRNVKLLGSKLPYDIDITEIEGFDNLHNPEGVIREIEKKAQEIYNSDNSFLLVNGSTAGITAGVHTALKKEDRALIARNCHKSVYNALELIGAEVEYLTPKLDEYGIFKAVDIYELEKKIKTFRPKLIVITTPTYEGVRSDLKAVCEIAHKYNIPVMADAAHGAHCTDIANLADITVMSLHKTLPALTQCAVAHINGNLISAQEYRIKLSIFETSSPSYVLMASIDECLDFISRSGLMLEKLSDERKKLIEQCKSLNHLNVFEYDDITKLIIFTGYSDINGTELSKKLSDDFNIEVEMACENYVVLITTVCDDFSDYEKLYNALCLIDKDLIAKEYKFTYYFALPEKAMNFSDITKTEFIDFNESADRISAEYVWAYPPGIPIITPGEIISSEIIDYIKRLISENVNVQSTRGKLPEKIYVLSS